MVDLSNVTPANTNEMPTPPETVTPEVAPVEPEVTVTPEVTPPAEEPKLPEVEDPVDSPFETTGNEFIDSMLTDFTAAEVDTDRLFGKFSETNDEADIDVAYLEEKVGKLAATGILAGLKAENDKLEEYVAEESKKVYEAAGGKELWDQIVEWIGSGKSGLTKEGGASYNAMLEAGGVQAELAARELSTMFKQSPGFTQTGTLVQADQTAQPTGLEQISQADYVSQLDVIARKEGEFSPAAMALHARREFTLSQGA
jgi:hypothetical protein